MSKEKPEVGDVWKNKKYGNILYITAITNTYIDFISFDKYDKFKQYFTNTFSKLHNDDRFEKFTEVNEYLGKSKANINDLFEVVECQPEEVNEIIKSKEPFGTEYDYFEK